MTPIDLFRHYRAVTALTKTIELHAEIDEPYLDIERDLLKITR